MDRRYLVIFFIFLAFVTGFLILDFYPGVFFFGDHQTAKQVPAVKKPLPLTRPIESSAPRRKPQTRASTGQVALNTASREELQTLPGVGPAIANRILAYRKKFGRFDELSEIKNVRGIGEKTYAKFEKLIKLE